MENKRNLLPGHLALVKPVTRVLRQSRGPASAIKAREIAWMFSANIRSIQSVVNHIRRNGIVTGLCANESGYYVARNPEEAEEYMNRLRQRVLEQAEILDNIRFDTIAMERKGR
jgi:5-formaminoimidazole-4-carboxamide-1-beta-D-ribofuranosyl 5'-monophosphate synthetase